MDQESSYQRRLIPVNIVVMVICLVAALSILFAPLLQIDLGKAVKAVQDAAASEETQDGEWAEAQQEAMETFTSALEGQKISIGTVGITKFAFSEDLGASITAAIAGFMDSLTDELIVKIAIPAIVSGLDGELGEAAKEADAEAIFEKFTALETCPPDERDAVIADLADTIEQEFGLAESAGISKEDIESTISNFYEDTVEQNEGKFTVEACICIAASKMQSDGEGDAPVYKSYEELISGVIGADVTGADEVGAALGEVSVYLRPLAYSLFFFAGVWLVLFLFALLHLFLPNKRFLMWYVKLFGGYPCIIYFLVPLLAKTFIAQIEGAAAYAAVLGAVSSMAWIGGLCYLLLWAVSIFWAFPIKRKIRKIRKGGAVA